MIVILKHEARQEQIDRLKQFLLGMGLRIDESKGENSTILGLVGDTTRVDADLISSLDAVEAVRRVQEPYKKANRKFHPQDTMVDCGGVTIGDGCVIGAGSVVTRDIPANSLAAGSPCRVIRQITEQDSVKHHPELF